MSPRTFGSVDPHPFPTASFAAVDGRPGTMIVAGTLKLFAVLLAAAAIAGVALFRAELVKLVPFVGLTGAVEPAIFAGLVVGVGLLFWAMSDALVLLAAHVDAHTRTAIAPADVPAPPRPAATPRNGKSSGVGDVPGFQRYQRPLTRVMKWTANVTNGPAYLATSVCEVASGETVTAIGEVGEFTFVETPRGNGWLPKDSLTLAEAV